MKITYKLKNSLLSSVLLFSFHSTIFAMGHFSEHGKDKISYSDTLTYYISAVPQIKADKIYGEMETNDGLVIVTKKPQNNSLNSVKIEIKNGERLYLVQAINGKKVKKISNEVLRFSDHLRIVILTPKNPHEIRQYHHPENSYLLYQTVRLSEYTPKFRGLSSEQFTRDRALGELAKNTELLIPKVKITKEDLKESLMDLINSSPNSDKNRSSGKNQKITANLEKVFKKYGYTVTQNIAGQGVVAEKAGTSGDWYIVGAHMDTVDRNRGGPTMGLDDDGSGSGIVLQIAKKLSNQNLKNGIKFYLFDNEEVGLRGSNAIASDLAKQGKGENSKYKGMIQVEMSMFKSDTATVIKCKGMPAGNLVTLMTKAFQQTGLKVTSPCTHASDHSPFWKVLQIPAIAIAENFHSNNPHYHKPSDKMGPSNKLARGYDYDYYQKIANATYTVVNTLAMD